MSNVHSQSLRCLLDLSPIIAWRSSMTHSCCFYLWPMKIPTWSYCKNWQMPRVGKSYIGCIPLKIVKDIQKSQCRSWELSVFLVSVSVSEHLVKETSFGISFGKKGFALEKFSIRKKSRSKFLCRHTVDTEVRLHPFGFNQLGCWVNGSSFC